MPVGPTPFGYGVTPVLSITGPDNNGALMPIWHSHANANLQVIYEPPPL